MRIGMLRCGEDLIARGMFHRAPDASKICIVSLIEWLQAENFTLLDCQQQSDHMRRFGAYEIEDADYQKLLRAALPPDGL